MPDSGSDFGDTAGEEDLSDFDPAIDEWAAVDPPAAVVSAGSSEADVDTASKLQPGAPPAAVVNATVMQPAAAAAAAAAATASATAPEITQHAMQGINAHAVPAPTDQPQSAAVASNAPATHPPAAAAKRHTGTATAPSAPQPHSAPAAPGTPAAANSTIGPSSSLSQLGAHASASGTANAGRPGPHGDLSHTGAPVAATASKAASASGWGLGTGGWGFSALSSKLQQVAIGAVADAKELGETFTKAMADMTADDEDDVEKLSAYQTRHSQDPAALPLEQGTSQVAPPTMVTTREESQHGSAAGFRGLAGGSGFRDEGGSAAGMTAEQRAAEQRRLEVLRRLEGEPVQLEAGLKVIDERVEQLASGAAKAIGSLWGGLTSLSSKVEAATLVLAKELVDTLEEGVSTVSRQAEKGLETAFGGRNDQPTGTSRSRHQRSSSAAQEALSFDHAFYVYGGRQSHEVLEVLSNECARISNKARANLDAAARARLDGALQQLAPYFDLDTPIPPASAQLGPTTSPSTGPSAPQPPAATANTDQAAASTAADYLDIHVQELLEGQYAPMAAQLKRARARAEELAAAAKALAARHTAAAAAAAAAAGQQGSTSSTASTGQQMNKQAGEIQAAEDTEEGHSEQQQQEEVQQQQQREGDPGSRALQVWLYDVQAAAVKALASLASGQQMMLLNLGRSVASPARYGKNLDDGISWPASGPAIAAILRAQATTMLADLQAAGACFQRLLPVLADLVAQQAQTQAGGSAVQQQQQQQLQQQSGQEGHVVSIEARGGLAEQLAAALEAHVSMAVSGVREGFRALLYVVLLASVHRDGLQEKAKQQGQQQQQQQVASPLPSAAAGLV